jgi:hypothetical protein
MRPKNGVGIARQSIGAGKKATRIGSPSHLLDQGPSHPSKPIPVEAVAMAHGRIRHTLANNTGELHSADFGFCEDLV